MSREDLLRSASTTALLERLREDCDAPDRPPRDGLVRAMIFADPVGEAVEQLRGVVFDEERAAASVDGSLGTMTGHFAVFNRWTEIDSIWEGNFLERIAPGAFTKNFREQGPKGANTIRSLFQHGRDGTVGSKPLGPYERLEEDEFGAAYDVPLLDTSYNRDLVPGLRAGLYGASFRFRVTREEFDQEPEASEDNPRGLPERTIKEGQVFEGGPVTFPAYADATAGMRSLTDEFFVERALSQPERLRRILDHLERTKEERAAVDEAAAARAEEATPADPAAAEQAPQDENTQEQERAADEAPAEAPATDDEPAERERIVINTGAGLRSTPSITPPQRPLRGISNGKVRNSAWHLPC